MHHGGSAHVPVFAHEGGWAEPEVYFRITYVTLSDSMGSAYQEQTVEISLGPKGAFEHAAIGTLTRRGPSNRVVSAVPPRRGKPRLPRMPRPPRVVELLKKAQAWQALLASGKVGTQADIARREGITRARVTQVMALLRLEPGIQRAVIALPSAIGRASISERALRPLCQIQDAREQIAAFSELLAVKSESTSRPPPSPLPGAPGS